MQSYVFLGAHGPLPAHCRCVARPPDVVGLIPDSWTRQVQNAVCAGTDAVPSMSSFYLAYEQLLMRDGVHCEDAERSPDLLGDLYTFLTCSKLF
jgi:hypothetical protein